MLASKNDQKTNSRGTDAFHPWWGPRSALELVSTKVRWVNSRPCIASLRQIFLLSFSSTQVESCSFPTYICIRVDRLTDRSSEIVVNSSSNNLIDDWLHAVATSAGASPPDLAHPPFRQHYLYNNSGAFVRPFSTDICHSVLVPMSIHSVRPLC